MADTTKLSDLINPQVMADMISAKIPQKIVVAPFAKVDTTLQGVPGSTITIPRYAYIGDAADVAEGIAADTVKLTTTSAQYTIKKAVKAVELTDEAVLSGFGNPVGETNSQLAKSIASKVDTDAIEALYEAQLFYDGSSAVLGYSGVVDNVDVFDEEVNTDKVLFVNPKQVTKLRKDTNFISADKYQAGVMISGEIGMICNTRIVPSKKVKLFNTWYQFCAEGTSNALEIVASGATTGQANLADVTPSQPNAKVGDHVLLSSTPVYFCPLVKLTQDNETEDEAAALTIYLKRDTNVETKREQLAGLTDVVVNKHYVAALTNTSKVALGAYKAS